MTLPPDTNNPQGLKSVLIARFSALGDVAMTIPVVYSVCRCYPDVRFTLVTRRSMVSMFVNPPANFRVEGIDAKGEDSGVGGLLRVFNRLRSEVGFDSYVDLQDSLRSRAFGVLCRLRGMAVSTINNGHKGKHSLTRRHNKILLPLISSRARYREAFFSLGLPVENRFQGLYGQGGKGDPSLFATLSPPKRDGEKWVGIAPFAKYTGKIYPPELMEEVVREVSSHKGVKIFLFGGGESEREILDRWASAYPGTVNLAGTRHGFPAELSMASWLDVMVSMDSANMHLASLVGTPVISIWGATHPYCGFKGWRQREDDTIQLPMTCRPCSVFGDKPCFRGDYHCLRGIAPNVITERILEYISR